MSDLSLNSSTTFIAVKVREVRPSVSMKVLCEVMEEATSGTEVWYLTFLLRWRLASVLCLREDGGICLHGSFGEYYAQGDLVVRYALLHLGSL